VTHVLHTVLVSYERPHLLKRTVKSYLRTVTLPHHLVVVDNGSSDDVRRWLDKAFTDGRLDEVLMLPRNCYPGYATNRGWELADERVTLLHRSDNDVYYHPGWCDEVVERFSDPTLGQLGMRTLEEEGPHAAVGGNCVVRRQLWDEGLRYDERPWTEAPFEDSIVSQRVLEHGYRWERVLRPCIDHIGLASSTDPYYQRTFAERGITFQQWGIK